MANGSTIRKILNRVSRLVFSNSARIAARILLPDVLNGVPALSSAYLISLISELASAFMPARYMPAGFHHTVSLPVPASDSRTRTEHGAAAEIPPVSVVER